MYRNYEFDNFHIKYFLFLPPATKLGQGYVFMRVCDSVLLFTGEGVWYPSMPCRSRGLWYQSMPCRSPGPHPRGKLRGLAWGVSRPTSRGSWGVWPGVSRPTLGGGLQAHTRGRVYQHALIQTPSADGYCCGQYASYWNAFLSDIIFPDWPKIPGPRLSGKISQTKFKM